MIVRKYEKSDFAQIREWAKAYDSEYEESQFPSTGYIVDGVAAYFLYVTDSTVCFLENLIANKDAPKELRDQAIELVIQAVLREAKDIGCVVAYATTNIPSVIGRAVMHGARAKFNYTLLTKQIGPS